MFPPADYQPFPPPPPLITLQQLLAMTPPEDDEPTDQPTVEPCSGFNGDDQPQPPTDEV